MSLDTILFYDATGGGVATVVAPTSFTIKGSSAEQARLVGYWLDGISAEEVSRWWTADDQHAGHLLRSNRRAKAPDKPTFEPRGLTLPESDGVQYLPA